MEKAASPRRQTSTRMLPRKESVREDSATLITEEEEEEAVAGAASPSSSSSPQQPTTSSPSTSSSIVDRSVRTRDEGRITLLLPSSASSSLPHEAESFDQRGWRSPHGEPYRPLGNPELSLKLTPRLPKDTAASSPRSPPVPSPSSPSSPNQVRHPSPPPPVDVLSMFPRDLRKRSGEDREVKLALRLQQSIAQYSPDKVQRLRVGNHVTITRVDGGGGDLQGEGGEVEDEEDVHAVLLRLCSSSPQSSPTSSPRYHVEHGDTSILRLRGAIHEGSSRLRLVRNGLSLLANVPTSDALDLTSLQRQYLAARHRFIISQTDKFLPSSPRLPSDAEEEEDPGEEHHATRQRHHSQSHNEPPLYLPYTNRQPTASPHQQLPSLAEVKARAREERLPRRTLASARAPVSSSPRKTMATLHLQSVELPSSSSPSPPLPHRQSRKETRRGSVVFAPPIETDPENPDALARAIASSSSSTLPSPSPPLHSVVRLQQSVDSLETAKSTHASSLAKTLTLLTHDRRECLATKAKHLVLSPEGDPLGDVERMRSAAEADRLHAAAATLAQYNWYHDLLKLMLSSRGDPPAPPLHPAEVFCVDVIRAVASEGRAFEWPQLALLLQLLHREDVAMPSVQCILSYLRRAVRVSPQAWDHFFQANPLVHEPVDVFKHQDAKQKEKRRLQRLAKLRAAVTMNAVVRRIATPQTPPQ